MTKKQLDALIKETENLVIKHELLVLNSRIRCEIVKVSQQNIRNIQKRLTT